MGGPSIWYNRKLIQTPISTKDKYASILRILPFISPRPSKSVLAKYNFFNKNQTSNSSNYSYAQIFKGNIENIIKIKDIFSKLLSNKIIQIYNVTSNKGIKREKLKINIIIKGLYKNK